MVEVSKGTSPTLSNRYHHIDGLRGWAALFVVCAHFFQECFGRLFPFLHSPLFGFIFDSHLMVLIFFILSGDALSSSYFRDRTTTSTIRLVISRYFRLTFPILISCLVVFMLMALGFTYNLEAAPFIHREAWLGACIDFTPSLLKTLEFSFAGVYFNHAIPTSYNPFLWTMSIELLGSMIVFLTIFVLPNLRSPLKVLIVQALFFLLFSPYYSLFIFGMILGYLRSSGRFEVQSKTKKALLSTSLVWVCIIGISMVRESQIPLGEYFLSSLVQNEQLHILWAMTLMALIYQSPQFLSFLTRPFSRFLGEISFPLYIVQFIVLISYTSYGIVLLKTHALLDTPWALILGLSSVLLSLILALLFRKIEKRYLVALNQFISTKIMGRAA